MFRTVDSEETSRSTSPTKELESPSSDEPQPGSSPVKKPYHREITVKMIVKELFFCLAFALTTYGALHSSPPKISKHPQAVPFFPNDSPVVDWYRGELTQALAAVNRAEISFVMYYAPWDAECQHVRTEFETTAKLLSDRVYFSAINCWNPDSECRLQHNKLPSWPIIMAYTVTSRGVLYKGPKDAQSMANFLELIMRPLRRVSTTEDLVSLLSICDAVAIGFTPLGETSSHYGAWYQAALRAREFEPLGEVCFAAVTARELAAELGAERAPAARLMLWNDTRDFPGNEDSWNSTVLLSWVLENFAQPVARVTPVWKKASSFERYVDGSPILMLFTPLNPLYEQIPNYALLREVAMEYYNCPGEEFSQWISELTKLQQVQRLLYQQRDAKRFCKEYKFKKPPPVHNVYKREVMSQYPWYNSTQKNQKTGLFNSLYKRGVALAKIIQSSEEVGGSGGLMEECSSLFPEEEEECAREQCRPEEGWLARPDRDLRPSMLPLEDDPLSPENLIQEQVKHFCKLMHFASSVNPPVLPGRDGNATLWRQVTGLSCAMNYSLYFIAVDSVRNYHFAESLGIDISKKKDRTAVVILDSKHESQYVLSEEYSASSIRDFIYNFTHKNLKRSLRSLVAGAAHTHSYEASDEDREYGVEVTDLTASSFRRVVSSPGEVTIVAVCGGACPAHVSRALGGAARLLAACGVRARAARLDARAHDLPWHLTPPAHPALLLFAPGRGREAALSAPPRQQRVSAGLVVALALRALGAPGRLRVRTELCRRDKTVAEKKRCLSDLKAHVAALLGRLLRDWRRARAPGGPEPPAAPPAPAPPRGPTLQRALLRRVVQLQPVHLHIDVLTHRDLLKPSDNINRLLAALETLAQEWDKDSLLKTAANPPLR